MRTNLSKMCTNFPYNSQGCFHQYTVPSEAAGRGPGFTRHPLLRHQAWCLDVSHDMHDIAQPHFLSCWGNAFSANNYVSDESLCPVQQWDIQLIAHCPVMTRGTDCR